jgi:hypothetical protein
MSDSGDVPIDRYAFKLGVIDKVSVRHVRTETKSKLSMRRKSVGLSMVKPQPTVLPGSGFEPAEHRAPVAPDELSRSVPERIVARFKRFAFTVRSMSWIRTSTE